jgi:hypothetical protein
MTLMAVLLLLQAAAAPSPCTPTSAVSVAASELCQAEQAVSAADALPKGSADRIRRLEDAAQHYRRAVDRASEADGKQHALDALADV